MSYALIVDDEDMPRKAIGRMVSRRDYQIKETDSVIPALETVAEHGHPDLVVSDINMPGLWGTDLAALLRGINPQEYARIFNGTAKTQIYAEAHEQFHGKIGKYNGPIVLLSGRNDNPIPNELEAEFEMKPVKITDLYKTIDTATVRASIGKLSF